MRKDQFDTTQDPTQNHLGRPRGDIDWTLFEQLCGIQCTRCEMASFLKVDEDTMISSAKKYYKEEDFSVIYKRFTEGGKCSLRRHQFVQSKTNATMAIWLGKQWLGQRDHEDRKDMPPNDAQMTLLIEALKENKSLKERLAMYASVAETNPVVQPSDKTV